MRRFFIEGQPLELHSQVQILGDELHHLRNVSRLEVGERLQILDGMGSIATGEIKTISKKAADVQIIEVTKVKPPSSPLIQLVVSIPQPQKMELIIQKAVELGCHSLIPVVSQRSFFQKIDGRLKEKLPRWNKISLEACKQSGRPWPMQIEDIVPMKNLIEKTSNGIFLYEGDGQLDIKSALDQLKPKNPATITAFIGSEGGFSLEEVQKFQDKGLLPVTMGELVLRVETACIAVLSVIQYEFDKMR